MKTKVCSNEIRTIGGIGVKNFGKQWRQGNRVYSIRGIAACLTAHSLGNTGGYSCLYLVPMED